MRISLAEQVCVCWLKNSELPWQPSNDVFALVERAMVIDHASRVLHGLEPQPVDLARYHSVLIRKPLSCVLYHDNARYSGGFVLDLFSTDSFNRIIFLERNSRQTTIDT
jgi:hypothetical protein